MASQPGQVPNVRTWSKSVPSYHFALGELDVYVLKQHDDVLAAMGWGRSPEPRRLGEGALFVLGLIAPLVAVATYVGDPRRGIEGDSGETANRVAAWCLAIALVCVVAAGVGWLRHRRHRRGEDVGVAAVTLGCGFATLAIMRQGGVDVAGLAPVSLTTWAAVVASAVLLVAMAVASRGKRVPFRRFFRVVGPADPVRVRERVDDLDPRRREKLLEERRAAVRRLRERGLVDDARAAAVLALPLGSSPEIDRTTTS